MTTNNTATNLVNFFNSNDVNICDHLASLGHNGVKNPDNNSYDPSFLYSFPDGSCLTVHNPDASAFDTYAITGNHI